MPALHRPAFRTFVKKRGRPFQLAIEDEVKAVLEDPQVGEMKKANLKRIRVHKFRFHRQEYLMAYSVEGRAILFCMIVTHDNFCRALKVYRKEVDSWR